MDRLTAGDGRDRHPAGRLEVVEHEPCGDGSLGNPLQAQRQLGDDGERPLGADQQSGQVVARGCLRGRAAGADDRPVCEHRLEREHLSAHLPVAKRRRAGGVGRRHPTKGCVGARVDREPQAVLTGGASERTARDARLHHHLEILGANCHDPIHPRQVERDPAALRNDVTLEARSGPERRHRDVVLVRNRKHGRDLDGGGRIHNDVGPARGVEAHVLRVQVALRVAVADTGRVAAKRGDQQLPGIPFHVPSLADRERSKREKGLEPRPTAWESGDSDDAQVRPSWGTALLLLAPIGASWVERSPASRLRPPSSRRWR